MVSSRWVLVCGLLLAGCSTSSEPADSGLQEDTEVRDTRVVEDGAPVDVALDLNMTDVNQPDAPADMAIREDVDVPDAARTVRNLCGDCAASCEAVPAGGNLYCVAPYEPPRESCDEFPAGACCDDSMCPDDGVCTAFSHQYCGGAAPPRENVCQTPECIGDGDCNGNEICAPAGVFRQLVNRCLVAECRSDADCSARAGGECTALRTADCGRVGGFHCTYDDDPCRQDSDCPSTTVAEQCRSVDGMIRCVPNPARP